MNKLTIELLIEKFGDDARSGVWFWVNNLTHEQRKDFIRYCREKGYDVFVAAGFPVVIDNPNPVIVEVRD